MKLAAIAALVIGCVWAGFEYPVIALGWLLLFALMGATYELIRTQK